MQLRRTLATSTAVLALAVPLTSCGFDYATARDYTPAAGANDRSADVDVLNAVIVSGQEGAGTVVASFDNNLIEADQGQALVSLSGEVLDSGESLGAITATAFEPIEIAPGKLVNLAEPPTSAFKARSRPATSSPCRLSSPAARSPNSTFPWSSTTPATGRGSTRAVAANDVHPDPAPPR